MEKEREREKRKKEKEKDGSRAVQRNPSTEWDLLRSFEPPEMMSRQSGKQTYKGQLWLAGSRQWRVLRAH